MPHLVAPIELTPDERCGITEINREGEDRVIIQRQGRAALFVALSKRQLWREGGACACAGRVRRTMMHVREACLVAIALLLAWLIWYTVWESYGDGGIDLMLGYVTAAIWSMAVVSRLVCEALS